MKPTILLADSEPWVEGAGLLLEDEGFRPIVYEDGKKLLRDLPELHYDLAVLSIQFPGLPDDSVIEESKELNPGVPVISVSGYTEFSPRSRSRYADGRLLMPFEPDELYRTIRKHLR